MCSARSASPAARLEWVVNAYALTFGALLLLGGRLGDLLGRRSVFIAGVLLFAGASLAGGFATSEAWLIATRVLQGAGAAVIAPTALALLTTTFAEGTSRNKAMGVYAATSAAGNSVGLLLGGVLVTYVSWRWVFFVNVPVGILLALLAPRVFAASKRMAGRFDLQGALTGSAGLGLLVYGISHAATDSGGISHWGDATTIGALAAAAVFLLAFVLIERRSSHPLMPLRIFADRNRCGAYLIVLSVVTAMFGIFFFLTIFMQTVWGYSALRSGVAYLPMALTVVLVATAQLAPGGSSRCPAPPACRYSARRRRHVLAVASYGAGQLPERGSRPHARPGGRSWVSRSPPTT